MATKFYSAAQFAAASGEGFHSIQTLVQRSSINVSLIKQVLDILLLEYLNGEPEQPITLGACSISRKDCAVFNNHNHMPSELLLREDAFAAVITLAKKLISWTPANISAQATAINDLSFRHNKTIDAYIHHILASYLNGSPVLVGGINPFHIQNDNLSSILPEARILDLNAQFLREQDKNFARLVKEHTSYEFAAIPCRSAFNNRSSNAATLNVRDRTLPADALRYGFSAIGRINFYADLSRPEIENAIREISNSVQVENRHARAKKSSTQKPGRF